MFAAEVEPKSRTQRVSSDANSLVNSAKPLERRVRR